MITLHWTCFLTNPSDSILKKIAERSFLVHTKKLLTENIHNNPSVPEAERLRKERLELQKLIGKFDAELASMVRVIYNPSEIERAKERYNTVKANTYKIIYGA